MTIQLLASLGKLPLRRQTVAATSPEQAHAKQVQQNDSQTKGNARYQSLRNLYRQIQLKPERDLGEQLEEAGLQNTIQTRLEFFNKFAIKLESFKEQELMKFLKSEL